MTGWEVLDVIASCQSLVRMLGSSGSERMLTKICEQMMRYEDDLVSSWSDDRKLIVCVAEVVYEKVKSDEVSLSRCGVVPRRYLIRVWRLTNLLI